ncbi:hypothetical protein Fleli_1449 [Bernardetia litoralis DSM 6794]|uniref:Lipoprotein n=1 Tax=Bernardetia litoralis (strain ATCC 23117 / DSM 6794 / NBRC 15988 / NCIMB 1366 / Fx l1 / Sio-4) TaxID=880071 RepID=I4AIU0_BERLS|nr:hypothetical protein [Bernardetia litoralis]AFM03875.1 hypothetical protein Fleli_1449 [Bernardetia litoralis DSM 6794]
MKNHILYSFFLLLTLVACSKEEENIKPVIPITDLPCEEQGTYFLSATIGDSVLCYASDSVAGKKYSFTSVLIDMEEYSKDTSRISVQIHYLDEFDNSINSIHYEIPIVSPYEIKNYTGEERAFYDRNPLIESITDKYYYSKNISNAQNWRKVSDFGIHTFWDDYENREASYFGFQDSSYIHLYNPQFVYDVFKDENHTRSLYRLHYDIYSKLYNSRGEYLHSIKGSGNFTCVFYFSN